MEKCLPEKLEVHAETRRTVTGSTTNLIRTALGSNKGRHGKRPVSTRQSHGMATHQMLIFITVFTSACNWSLSTATLKEHTPSQTHYTTPLNISVQSAPESSLLLRASAKILEYISHPSYVSPVSNLYKRRYFALKWRLSPTPNNVSGTTFYTHYSS